MKLITLFASVLLTVASFAGTSCVLEADETKGSGWTNLIENIDTARDTVEGQWSVRGEELTVAAAEASRLTIPIQPSGEYDFRVKFTRHSGSDSIALMFVAGGHQCAFDVDGWGQHLSGIQLINRQDMRAYRDRVASVTLQNEKQYTAVVEVRKDQIRTLLDGKLLHAYRTDGSDLSLVDLWRIPDTKSLGLGAWNSATTFHSVEVRAIGDSPLVASATPVRNASPVDQPMRKTPRTTSTATPDSVPSTKAPAGNSSTVPRVLIVIANHHFFYREYADPKEELEKAGIKVTIAAGRKSVCDPHQNSGEGSDGGRVTPDIALADAKADDFDAIVFSGGWGSSMYQYAFRGNYSDRAYNGDRTSKEAANRLINDFISQDKYVGGICHGVSVLAWARVNDRSPLADRRVVAPQINGPAGVYNGQQAQPPSRWNAEQNGAQLAPARSVGSPSPEDDVMVDGKILTAEDDHAARHFGAVLARLLLAPM